MREWTGKMFWIIQQSFSRSFLLILKLLFFMGKCIPGKRIRLWSPFAAGEIQILVSTTVIEVGVNVPNATVMMVENAERFGLAQLHQLRGRVGRWRASVLLYFCTGKQRRHYLKETGNPQQIQRRILYCRRRPEASRGPGDLFGIRQSGVMEFRIGDIYNDSSILKSASEAASEILSLDLRSEQLTDNQLLKEQLQIVTNRSILVP